MVRGRERERSFKWERKEVGIFCYQRSIVGYSFGRRDILHKPLSQREKGHRKSHCSLSLITHCKTRSGHLSHAWDDQASRAKHLPSFLSYSLHPHPESERERDKSVHLTEKRKDAQKDVSLSHSTVCHFLLCFIPSSLLLPFVKQRDDEWHQSPSYTSKRKNLFLSLPLVRVRANKPEREHTETNWHTHTHTHTHIYIYIYIYIYTGQLWWASDVI